MICCCCKKEKLAYWYLNVDSLDMNKNKFLCEECFYSKWHEDRDDET